MERRDATLLAPLTPRLNGRLPVDALHTLYWEEAGAADGVPIVILHGGPGGGIRPYHWRVCDPARFRMIAYDQRGCGRSSPFASLERNTTWDLVADLEALRVDRGIDKWIVLGGSWGSALGLAYAETHPDRCLAVVVFGVIVERKEDLWWWWEGARFVYPEVWEAFRDALPPGERDAMRANYVRRVLDPNPAVHGPAALAWLRYESQTLDVWPDEAAISAHELNPATIGAARVFAHYDAHDFFLEDSQLLANVGRLRDVPGLILNGRFDMCTPPRTAWDLHRAWLGSELAFVPAAGHRWTDPLLALELRRAVSRAADRAES